MKPHRLYTIPMGVISVLFYPVWWLLIALMKDDWTEARKNLNKCIKELFTQ